MGQLHALKIHFKRQPRQVRAVGNSEQNFGNSADRFPHQAFVPLLISDVLRHTHLGNGVANVVVQEGEFQSSSDRSLASPFDDHRHQGGNETISTTAPVVALTYHEVFPCHRTALSATPMNATTMPITAAVIRDWKRDAEANLKTFLCGW